MGVEECAQEEQEFVAEDVGQDKAPRLELATAAGRGEVSTLLQAYGRDIYSGHSGYSGNFCPN